MPIQELYIQFPCNFDRTPQGLELRALLGDKNCGSYVARLWGWAFEQRRRTCDLSPQAIAALCEWDRSPATLLEAFYRAKVLRQDDHYIHGWDDRYGPLFAKRERERARSQHNRDSAKATATDARAKANAKAERERVRRAEKKARAGHATGTQQARVPVDIATIAQDMQQNASASVRRTYRPKAKAKDIDLKAAAPSTTEVLQAPAAASALTPWVDEVPHSVAEVEATVVALPTPAPAPDPVAPDPTPEAPRAPLSLVSSTAHDILAGAPRGALRADRSASARAAPTAGGTHPKTSTEVRAAAEAVWPGGRMTAAQGQQVVDGGWSWSDIELVLRELKKRKGSTSPALLLLKLKEDLQAMKNQEAKTTGRQYGGVTYDTMRAMAAAVDTLLGAEHGAALASSEVMGRIAAAGVTPEQAASMYAELHNRHDGEVEWREVAEALEQGRRAPEGLRPRAQDDERVRREMAEARRKLGLTG